jgi:hypothetical protein
MAAAAPTDDNMFPDWAAPFSGGSLSQFKIFRANEFRYDIPQSGPESGGAAGAVGVLDPQVAQVAQNQPYTNVYQISPGNYHVQQGQFGYVTSDPTVQAQPGSPGNYEVPDPAGFTYITTQPPGPADNITDNVQYPIDPGPIKTAPPPPDLPEVNYPADVADKFKIPIVPPPTPIGDSPPQNPIDPVDGKFTLPDVLPAGSPTGPSFADYIAGLGASQGSGAAGTPGASTGPGGYVFVPQDVPSGAGTGTLLVIAGVTIAATIGITWYLKRKGKI